MATRDTDRRLRALFAWTERVAQTGSWEYLTPEREVFWSDNLYRIFGVEPGEFELSTDNILAHVHPDDRQRVMNASTELIERGGPWSLEYRITRPNRDQRHLRATLAIDERRDDAPGRLLGVVEDLTDRRRAEREIAAHIAVEHALADRQALDPGARGLLTRLATALDCVVGVFWVPRDDVLLPRVVWHQGGIAATPLAMATQARPVRRASGLPGRVWEAGTPLSWTAGEQQVLDPRDAASRGEGLTGAVAIPAIAGGDVLAIIELATDREIKVNDSLARSLHGIAHELGYFLARRAGELAAPLLTPREIEIIQLVAVGLSRKKLPSGSRSARPRSGPTCGTSIRSSRSPTEPPPSRRRCVLGSSTDGVSPTSTPGDHAAGGPDAFWSRNS